MFETNKNCLCGRDETYSLCCQPYHDGLKNPATAENLMRSRFTAYVMQNEPYLLNTWVVSKRPKNIDFSQDDSMWTKLEVIQLKKGQKNDKKGIVEFKAYYEQDGEESVMNEISQFQKIDGRWLYLNGRVKSIGKVSQQKLQGKNAACPCGSGKKFKRCCQK